MDINRGEPGEVEVTRQMSRFTENKHPLRQSPIIYQFIVMFMGRFSQMLFYSLIKSLSGCSHGKRSYVFFCALKNWACDSDSRKPLFFT